MSHKYTKETIYHFTCSACANWWSYATHEDFCPQNAFCPFCGTKDAAEPKDPGQKVQVMVKLTPQRIACGD